ncbi:hypothetical protein [Sphingomonas lenta]|uniref:Uncharacterized protein n=1 Tax=Sphingomonas lenta TaxID=1141887 RepID=A0A2A2SBL4_9SPHN|nr:hypothetical protein [Sphingomonas lenta]PAX06411.1 hypothetical protein CKY28_17605 [Sphingomonas lenta]
MLGDVVSYTGLVEMSLWQRRDAEAHKRLMVLDVAVMMGPAAGHVLAPKLDVRPTMTEPPSLARQFAQAYLQGCIIRLDRAVAHTRAICAHDAASTPLADDERDLNMRDRLPLMGRTHYLSDKRSFKPALSSMASVECHLGMAFSPSSARSHFASDASILPYLALYA